MELKAIDDAELALRARIGGDIYERSTFHRNRLDRSGLGKNGIHRLIDLTRLAPMTLDDVKAPSSLLLLGANEKAPATRRYAPLEWIQAGPVPLAYSDDDLMLLGDLGSRILKQAGLQATDLIANLVPAGATREHVQLTLGAQIFGVASIELGPNQTLESIALLDPTVLIGDAPEITRVLDAASLDEQTLTRLHTVIVTGNAPTPRQYKAMTGRFGGNKSAVMRAWAPDGVLSLWGQCRGGSAFHTWPGVEVVEIVDPVAGLPAPVGMAGQVLWTGVGWYSSALLRLDTYAAVIAHDDVCPTCGRRSMRLEPMEIAGGFPEVLDASSHVQSWYAELQRNDSGDELAIWAVAAEGSGLLELLTELNLKIGPVQVNLVDQGEVERRIVEANGERFADHRSF